MIGEKTSFPTIIILSLSLSLSLSCGCKQFVFAALAWPITLIRDWAFAVDRRVLSRR